MSNWIERWTARRNVRRPLDFSPDGDEAGDLDDFIPVEGIAASLPEGCRVYAIGDLHGRVDLLEPLLARIEDDETLRPVGRSVIVTLGDYVDRGPWSRQVIDRLIQLDANDKLIAIRGNHDSWLVDFLEAPEAGAAWARLGGLSTLASYGLSPTPSPSRKEFEYMSRALNELIPSSHIDFLKGLRPHFSLGDYVFVHAGLRPGIAIDHQRENDLMWIRDEFLDHEQAFEKFVVHGHTPTLRPEVLANRINIDTGAYATGRLTCLVLEADTFQWL